MIFPKKLFAFVILASFSFAMLAQQSPVKQFMKAAKKEDRSRNKIALGGLPLGIAKMFLDDDLKPLAKPVKKVSLLNIEENKVSKSRLRTLYKQMKGFGYEEMLTLNEGGQRIAVQMKDSKKRIKYVTAVIEEENSQVIIELKTRASYDQIVEMIHTYTN